MKFSRIFSSSVGLKIIMGCTGVLLFLWVTIHMLGNLQLFAGAHQLNQYAKLLKWSPEALWGARLGLLAIAALHFFCSLKLTLLNEAARPVGYQQMRYLNASLSSKTMIYTGALLALFVLYHLWHFTISAPAESLPKVDDMLDVYSVVVKALSDPVMGLIYVCGVGLLAFHLSHGVFSWFTSLGLTNPGYAPLQERFALLAAVVLFLGFAAIPVACMLHLVHL